MIYLKNNTILQELYIPRQDYISNTTGSSGTYAEGYADGYESGYTSGSTDGFDSGYTEGYSSGETHQKGLLTSTGITENGEYQREDGWSAITVNVSGSVLEGKEIVVSEDITVVTPDSGYGGFSAVTVDATEYGQENYDSGFDDGFEDGYASGSSEGYDSGYTSGETHQKSLLVSTAITENGSYQRENGYSAITVNVPIPKVETNKEFTATTNGYYWVAPTSGSVSINDRFDNDDDCYYITATTSGYPLIGRYNIFYIEDEFDSSKGQIDVYIDNGYLDYDDSDWNGGRIMDYETGDILRLKVYDANNGFGWMRDDDYNLKYDAMNGLGVVVEVPQTGHTDQELQDAYDSGYTSGSTDGYNAGYQSASTEVLDEIESSHTQTLSVSGNGTYQTHLRNGGYPWEIDGYLWDEVIVNVPKELSFVDYIHTTVLSASQRTAYIDTGIIPTTATTFRVQGMYKGYAQDGVIVGNTLYDNRDYRLFWAGSNSSPEIYYDFNEDRLGGYENHLYNGTVVDITCDNYSITFNGSVLGQSYTQYAVSYPQNILLDVGSWWAKSLEIWNEGVKVFDGKAAIDEDGNIGLYDSVSMSMVYNSGLTMAYEGTPISQDYASGYTDGQSSVISTFTAATATTNGVYGSSASPLSSITVNVPQSGANGKSLLFDRDINNQVDVYTDTTNKYYFGNGYKTIIRFHKNNSGHTSSGITWCGASDLGDNGYSENGFGIGAQSFVVESNALSSWVRFTQSPKANGWESAEVGLSYSGNVCNYYLSYNGEIFISSSFTRSTTVENHYGLRVGVGNALGLFGFESLKTYDSNDNLIGYVVYNPLTNMLMDLLDSTITFSPSAGTVSDLSGQYL